ncbi:hypothetical protein Esi_0105_0043 [Ectocarpus siliculosus]|uniref:Uncharacterized protein n=1 Tax=Ectocarpus siliculosus TaxID=2880 RepID=D7FH55_ECTSI|nr:hypothetical protein Esi_0105_0043 [Ectocarpus siliculosus]|eukprot:CBJ28430.1 hypothetical protein Esi_0105_0043 [Ectocarpus siliculosus]
MSSAGLATEIGEFAWTAKATPGTDGILVKEEEEEQAEEEQAEEEEQEQEEGQEEGVR